MRNIKEMQRKERERETGIRETELLQKAKLDITGSRKYLLIY